MRYTLTAILVAITVLACSRGAGERVQSPEGPVSKIAVLANGTVTMDGLPITIDALKTRLSDLKSKNGAVLYYREAGDAQPPQQAVEVVKLITDNRLPISLSTKPDYSDVVLPDGTTKPRGGDPRPN